jgi:hypothetical protein
MLAFVVPLLAIMATPAAALYTPDRLTLLPYNIEQNSSSINISFGQVEIPNPFVIEETNIVAGATGFNRNEHLARFATNGETSNSQFFGHRFQRSEAWDISFDMKIETPHPTPRKEAGIYFEGPTGNAMFVATSNAGHFTDGPGDITTVFQRVIPPYNFSGTTGPLGDYNKNGIVDGADYVVWRDTLGSTTDFRANGNNEGTSKDLIDQADYDTWRGAFGQGNTTPPVTYQVGDTLNMRMIYTPPVIDPLIPFNISNPSANVITSGMMEYQIRKNGGPVISTGPLDWSKAYTDTGQNPDGPAVRWMGIPDGTFISLRVQNLSLANVAPDSAKVTFSNLDFNGPSTGAGLAAGVPEPSAAVMAVFAATIGVFRRKRRLRDDLRKSVAGGYSSCRTAKKVQ